MNADTTYKKRTLIIRYLVNNLIINYQLLIRN